MAYSLGDLYEEIRNPGFLSRKRGKETERLALEVATFDQSDGQATDLLRRLLRAADADTLRRIWDAAKADRTQILVLSVQEELARRQRHHL